MSDILPAVWRNTSLSEVTRTRSGNGKLIKGKLLKEPSAASFPAFSASGQDVWTRTADHTGSAVIVSAVCARCGKCFRADGSWSAIANTHIIWPRDDLIDRDYLWWLINDEGFWKKGGSAQPFVKVADTFRQPCNLPPLAEQRRIVERIEALFARTRRARADLVRITSLASVYRQQRRKRAFDEDARWELAGEVPSLPVYTPPKRFDELRTIPESWQWAEMATVSNVGGGLTKNQARANNPIEIPYLRVGNVYADELRLDRIEMIKVSIGERIRISLLSGDLLVVEGNGSVEQIGRVAIWDGSIPFCGHQNHLIRVRPKDGLPSRFILHWLMSPYGRSVLETVASSSSGLHTLSLSKVASIPIPVPPMITAEKVVAALDQAAIQSAKAEREAARSLLLLERLEQRILARAFRGELVPQESNASDVTRKAASIHPEGKGLSRRGRRAA